MGTTAAQKKLFFNLRKLKARIQALEDGDLYPENVSVIAELAESTGGRSHQHEPAPDRPRPVPERAAPR